MRTPFLAEDISEKVGAAIDDLRLLRKVVSAIDESNDLHDPHNAVQVTYMPCESSM